MGLLLRRLKVGNAFAVVTLYVSVSFSVIKISNSINVRLFFNMITVLINVNVFSHHNIMSSASAIRDPHLMWNRLQSMTSSPPRALNRDLQASQILRHPPKS